MIRDGGNDNAPVLGSRYCGDIKPPPILSSSNELYVHFHSDHSFNNQGFKLKVENGIFILYIFDIEIKILDKNM